MADLVIDYALIHDLAHSVRSLRTTIDSELHQSGTSGIWGSAGTIPAATAGRTSAGTSLSAFYRTCHGPFQQSLDRLEQLATMLDSVAQTWFDNDANFASALSVQALQSRVAQWQGQQQAYQHYLDLKNTTISYQYYDENGQLQTASFSLWDPNAKPPDPPGAMPTTADPTATLPRQTNATLDDKGRIVSETTTVTGPGGLSYTETTTYTYNGDHVDYTTTITHSDGTTETLVKTTNPDNSYVIKDTTHDGTSTTTVTPGPNDGFSSVTTGSDGSRTTVDVVANPDGSATKTETNSKGTDVYTGNVKTGQWTLTSHTDPPSDPPDPLPVEV